MAKGEAKKTNQAIDRGLKQSDADYSRLGGGWESRMAPLQQRADADNAFLRDTFKNALGQSIGGPSRPPGSGAGYGQSREEYLGMKPMIEKLQGPVSEKGWGRETYQKFADEGISPAEEANMRLRASRTGAAAYDAFSGDLDKMNAAQGGFNPGYNAQTAKLLRDRAKNINDANIDAESNILSQDREAMLAGAGGLATTKNAIQGYNTQQLIAALSGQGNMAQGLSDVTSRESADDLGWGKLGLEAQGMEANRLANLLGGYLDFYRSSPGELMDTGRLALGAYGQRGNERGNLLGTRAQNNPNISAMDRLIQLGGAAGGIMGAF